MPDSMEGNIAKWKAGLSGGDRYGDLHKQPVMKIVDKRPSSENARYGHTPVASKTPTSPWFGRK